MNSTRPRRFTRRRLVTVGAIAMFVTVIYTLWPVPVLPLRNSGGDPGDKPLGRHGADHAGAEEQRSAIISPDSGGLSPEVPVAIDTSFDELFERLVAIYLAGMEANTANDTDKLRQIRAAASGLLQRLTLFTDAGPDSLEIARRLPAHAGFETGQLEVDMRRTIASQLIEGALVLNRAKFLRGSAESLRANRDLVHWMLASIPINAGLMQMIGSILDSKPYLERVHEDQVLLLAEVALEKPGLQDLVSGLLFTLWTNIKNAGEIPGEILNSIVLTHRNSENPSKRIAAWRFLLANGSPAIRELTLRQILDKKDIGSMRIVALSVVATMKPTESLAILKRLAPICAGQLTSAYLNLGYKARELIREEYENCLGSGVLPNHRAQLVNASVFAGSSLAQLALEHDQQIVVKRNALLIVSGRGTVEQAEKSLHRALDSSAFSEGPDLSIVVTGLEAMASRSTDPNPVVRILDRLDANPFLTDEDRAKLDRIRRQYLPR